MAIKWITWKKKNNNKKEQKTVNRQPNFIPKTTGKRSTKKDKLVEGKKS